MISQNGKIMPKRVFKNTKSRVALCALRGLYGVNR